MARWVVLESIERLEISRNAVAVTFQIRIEFLNAVVVDLLGRFFKRLAGLGVLRAVIADEVLADAVPAGRECARVDRLRALGVHDDLQALPAVDVGRHGIEHPRHGAFGLGQKRLGRELVAMLDLPHAFVEKVEAKAHSQRHQRSDGKQTDSERLTKQGNSPLLAIDAQNDG